jgi:hypothetical protein
MVLKLQKQIKKMQKDMNQIFDDTSNELIKEQEIHKSAIENSTRELNRKKKVLY